MIVIVAAGGTNYASIVFALERLGKQALVTTDAQQIQSASHVILPGVGTAHQAMLQLENLQLTSVIQRLQQPVLGICLGMQILYDFSEEGKVDCLKIISGNVTALPSKQDFTLPHMGWNTLTIVDQQSPLLKGIAENSYVYYVHGYAASVNSSTSATTQYTNNFTAICQNNNFFGVQFHPERSGKVGAEILKNFIALK